jgi:hypothetical protein
MKYLIFISCLLSSLSSYSQRVVLYNRRRIAYTQMENYVSFYSKEASCSSLVIKTDNGLLTQRQCMFVFIPAREGRTVFKVYKDDGGHLKLWDSVEVMVYKNRIGEARVASKTAGSMSKDQLIAYGGVTVYVHTRDDHSEPISVESYSIVIHKVDNSILYGRNYRNIFETSSIDLLQKLQPGDRITFANIRVIIAESSEIIVKPIEFTIE